MKNYLSYLRIDCYKFWNSKILISHQVIPISGIVLMLMYFSFTNWTEFEQVLSYFQVIAMSFPFIICIVTTLLYEQEEEARFQFLLTAPTKKIVPHLSKLTVILLLGGMSTFIAIFGFGVVFNTMKEQSFNLSFYLKETMLMFISYIPLYMLQYLVVFSLGRGVAFGVGIIGSLISALLITGIGDGIWFLLPWGYAIRMTTYLFQTEMMHSLSDVTQGQLIKAVVSILIWLSVSIVGLVILGQYWEGKKEQT